MYAVRVSHEIANAQRKTIGLKIWISGLNNFLYPEKISKNNCSYHFHILIDQHNN